jgi:hypothetical protein
MAKADPDNKVKDLLEQFSHDVAADKHNRDMQMDDLNAYVGAGQWDEEDRAAREAEKRPLLEQNQLPKFARQTIGDIREAEPSIKISPDGDGADQDAARIYNGLIRQAQKRAAVTKPVITAAESAVICGIGNFRVVTQYLRDNPFHQELGLEAIHNPLAVVWDANAREVTRADAQHVFIREALTRAAFKKKYKGAREDSFSGDEHDVSKATYAWTTKDTITVAEYFEVGSEKAPYALLQSGAVVRLDRLPERIQHNTDANTLFDTISQQAMPIQKIKEGEARKVTWRKMTGLEVLETRDWITEDIPVIAVVGEQVHFHDRTVRVSLIRYAKAAQKIYNYGVNAQLEMAMNAPKAPYLLGTSQLPEGKGAELWAQANKGNKPYLPYNDSKNPNRPVREPGPQPSSALQAIIFQAAEDLKATTGIYDAAIGNRSNETSGIAIANRQREAETGTNLFSDNLEASLTHAGRIMVDAIPKIYDSERILRITGEDGSEEEIAINRRIMEGGVIGVINDLTVGRYDLSVNIGPSAATKRAEALQGMERVLSGSPQMLAQFFDLWVEKMDFPGAEAFAKRARKLLPPGLAESRDEDKTPEQAEAEKVQAAAAEEQQQLGTAKVEAEVRKDAAMAAKAEAEAKKSALEADALAIRNAIESGQLDGVINARVVEIVQQLMAQQAPIPAL